MLWVTSFFNTVVSMSLDASVVILVVLLLRMLFKKAPKVFSYFLWTFVLVRLLVPITLESNVSVLSIPETISSEIVGNTRGISEVFQSVTVQATNSVVGLTIVEVLSVIWLLGIIILIAYFIKNYRQVYKVTRYAMKVVDNIYESDAIAMPFVMGICNPRIYIPTTLNERQKQIVLAHEIIHVQRKDYFIKYLGLFLLIIYWFNPLVWISFYYMSMDMELSCDEKVVRRLGIDCKYSFGSTLLEFAMNPYVLFVSFNESNTKVRIKNIMNYKKPKFWIILVCIVVGILCIIPLLTNPKKEPNNTPVPIIAVTPNITNEPSVKPKESSTPEETKDKTTNISFIAPLENYEVTCAWGCYAGHQAIDMHDPKNPNADVLASAKGTIIDVGYNNVNGNYILIEHEEGYKTGYAHLKDETSFKIGDEVNQGDKIGTTGMTGRASGEHVHFFIMKDDSRLSNTMEFIQ